MIYIYVLFNGIKTYFIFKNLIHFPFKIKKNYSIDRTYFCYLKTSTNQFHRTYSTLSLLLACQIPKVKRLKLMVKFEKMLKAYHRALKSWYDFPREVLLTTKGRESKNDV